MKKSKYSTIILLLSFSFFYYFAGLSDYYHTHNNLKKHNEHQCKYAKFSLINNTTENIVLDINEFLEKIPQIVINLSPNSQIFQKRTFITKKQSRAPLG